MLTRLVVRFAGPALVVLASLVSGAACVALAQEAPAEDARAQDNAPHPLVFRPSARNSQLSITEKEVRLLELPARIRSVDGFDPTIVKIDTVNNFHQVRMLALVPGFTSVVLVDENGQSYTVDVLVNGDVKQFQALIRQAAPGSSVQAIKVKDAVLLVGWVDQAGEATKIVELAELHFPKVLNYLRVSGVQTIMLRVRIMEAQRDKIRALGFNFLQLRPNNYVGSLPGALVPFSNQTPAVNLANPFGGFVGPVTSAVVPTAATAVFGMVSHDNAFQGFIEALKQENLLTILAEPNLVTTNGRPANFLDGGQFPIPIPQGLGTVSVQYKSFGVQLEFVPTILSSGRLRMQVCPEVSEKDLSNTVTVQGITVPSLTTRRVNTEVEMNFGETLIIGGLISNRVQASTSKIPFLGELPWIGAAFRRVAHTESETELIVMVTPELTSPTDQSELPDGPGLGTVTPTDRELYWNGYMETPRYARDPEPPPSNFGYPQGVPQPPEAMVPGGMPGPLPQDYEGASKAAGPQVPGGRSRTVPPTANTVAPAPAAQPEAAPIANPPDAGEIKTDQAAGGDGKHPASALAANRKKKGGSQKTAGSATAARPVKPTRVPTSRGPIVPASGIKPAAEQQGEKSGDLPGERGRPGLIGPS
jgi:pilus assembly protein CpaC